MKILGIEYIAGTLNDIAKIFKGSALNNALQDIYIKSIYLFNIYNLSRKIGLDLNEARILDVGCSKCDVLLTMQKIGSKNLTGLNLFSFDVQWLSNDIKYSKYFGDSPGKIKYVVCDVDKELFPFVSSNYDMVLLLDIIEHLNNPKHTLLECYRVLSPGGLIVIATPNAANLKNRFLLISGKSVYYPLEEWLSESQRIKDGIFRRFIGHIREYTMEETLTLLKMHGFDILYKRYYPSNPKVKPALFHIYRLFEVIFPFLSYHMLIIGRKPVTKIAQL